MFAFSCKQANNGVGHEPTISDEITITINGDEGVIVSKLNTIKIKKSLNLTWKDIKRTAEVAITTKESKEIKEWRIKDAKGAVLQDADAFEKDTIIFAVSKDKEKPTPPTNPIIITIEIDEGYTFKEATKPCIIEAQKGNAWASIKAKAEAKIELKDSYEKTGWKLGGKDGGYLEDSALFNENALIFATSKKKGEPDKPKVTITVKGDEGVEVGSPDNFTVDSGSKWAEIKTQAEEKAKAKENFEIKEWHLNNKDGTLINDETEFKGNTTIFAVSKRKVVQYKVEHLKENIENDEFTLKETEEKQGEAGKNTLAVAKQYEGFSCQGLAQEEIKADGSTVIQIKYKRKITALAINLAGGSTTTKLDTQGIKTLLKGKYGASVRIETPTKENYTFEKWQPKLPATFLKDDDTQNTYTAQWKRGIITITVEGDEGITVKDAVPVSAYKGYKWVQIKEDVHGKIKLDDNFQLQEWRLNNNSGKVLQDDDVLENDLTVYAVTKRKIVKYTVEHLQENVNDNEYSRVDNDTEEKNGEAGKKTCAKAREYDGFETQTITQKTIKADGTTVVQIKYKRKVVSLIIDLAGGTTTTELENKSGKTLLSGKYGASVTIEVPTKNKHEFDRWNPALPANFPKENDTQNTYQALWKPIIQINIYGDERLDVTSPIEFPAFDGINWENVKAKVEKNVVFKSDWSNGDYEIYDWKTEDGSLIRDNTPVIDEMKVYIRTNYAKFKWDENKPTELIDYEGEKPRGKIIIPAKTTKMKSKIFKDCSEITDVDIAECEDIIQLDLRGTGIMEIDLTVCPKLKYFHFGDCKKLEKVIARNLKEVDTLQDFFSGCTALKHIDLTGCDKLKYIGGLAWVHYHFKECTALETLNLTGCTSLKKIDLADTTVKKLIGIQCQKAEEINLSNCKNLEEIDLRACDLLISIDYGGRYKITKLNFSGSVNAVVTLPKVYLGDSLPRGIFGNNPSNYCKQVRVLSPYYKNIVKNTGYPENRIEIYTP